MNIALAPRSRRLRAAALAAALALAAAGAAQAKGALEGSPRIAEIGAMPDPLPLPVLIEASLLASGVDPARQPAYTERVAGILGEAAAFIPAAGRDLSAAGDAAAGAALLDFLHARVFRDYSESATTLDGLLDSGRYNCVSSALLYLIAARSLGLEASGSRTTDHALVVLRAEGRDIDIETTNPYGFDPGTRKEFKDSFGKATGFAYVAPGAYSQRKAISERGMIGLVISNRASLLERRGDFAGALALGVDYYALCRDPDSRAFLADRVNNEVAYLSSRGDYRGAEALAAEAAAALPGEPSLAALADLALEGLAASLAARGDFEGAREAVLARVSPARSAAADRALAAVADAELVAAANGLPFAQAVRAVDRIAAAGGTSASRYAQAIASIYGREAARIGREGDYLAAAALAEEGAAKAPGDGSLARAAAAMRRNFVVASHNAFAVLYNAGDYAGARRAAEEALESAPGDATLASDLAAAIAAAAR